MTDCDSHTDMLQRAERSKMTDADLIVWCREREIHHRKEATGWRQLGQGSSMEAVALHYAEHYCALADRIEQIAADTKDLPDWDDIRGMAPDATGDLSSEDFVRKMRNEEWRS